MMKGIDSLRYACDRYARTIKPPEEIPTVKYLRRVRLSRHGYALRGEHGGGGTYFGNGDPLYVAIDSNGDEYFFRAATRAIARDRVARAARGEK